MAYSVLFCVSKDAYCRGIIEQKIEFLIAKFKWGFGINV